MKYDLEERTTNFSKEIIAFCRNVKNDQINLPLLNQLIRSATSIGANYHEANSASSKKDFKNKIFICKKEAQETKYWLTLVANSNPEQLSVISGLSNETQQLILIFGKILSTLRFEPSLNN